MQPTDSKRRKRLLIAEDDPALRRLLELRLGVEAYDIKAVEDGADALDAAHEWEPDVLVTDVMMPKVSGLTVCRELRNESRFQAMPIILLTARVFDEDIESVMGLGGITFMNKPFKLDELTDSIAAAMSGEEGDVRGSDRLGWHAASHRGATPSHHP